MDEEVGVFDPAESAQGVKAGPGNDAMEVGMEDQLLGPGVEDCGEAVDAGANAFGQGEALGERKGDGGKEDAESFLCQWPKEQLAQFFGQGEGDQEIGGSGQLLQLACDPEGRCGPPALRAGLVVATMPGEALLVLALRAGMEVPAQGRGAALVDRVEGAPLSGGEGWLGREEPRQKAAQHLDDGVAVQSVRCF